MRQVSIHLKFVTRTYLGGADPRMSNPEMRIPSIRGLLRYWLRAAAGASNPDIGSVRQREEDVFGSVNHGSPVALWLSNLTIPPPSDRRVTIGSAQPSPYVSEPPSMDQKYLFWSMNNKGSWRMAYPAGTEFDLYLAGQRGSASEERDTPFWRALGALWLLAHLGGIGARSRRGAGSLSPLRIEAQSDIPDTFAQLPFTPPASAEELRERLQTGIKAVCVLMANSVTQRSETAAEFPAFDVLARHCCRIWILRPATGVWSTADDALDGLGASLREGRRRVDSLEARAVFGLPIIARDGTNIHGRRASPLRLSVTSVTPAIGEPEYLAVATLFKSQFQPTSAKRIQGSPNYRLIEDWITGDEYLSRMEVEL